MDIRHEALKKKFDLLSPHLDEKSRRLYLAVEAQALGVGGISTVSEITGVSRSVIANGIAELELPSPNKTSKNRSGPQK